MVDRIKTKIKIVIFTFCLLLANKTLIIPIFVINILLAIYPFLSIQLNGTLINAITFENTLVFPTFICIIIITALNTILSNIYNYLLINFQCKLNLYIEELIINKAAKLEYHYFENSEVYDQLKRASTDAITKPFVFFTYILNMFKSILQICSIIILLSSSEVQNIEILFLVSAALIVPNLKIIKKEYLMHKDLTILYRKKNYLKSLVTNAANAKEVKIFNLSNWFIKQYCDYGRNINQQVCNLNKKKNQLGGGSQLAIFAISSWLQFNCIKNTLKGMYPVGQMAIYIQTIAKVNTVVSDLLSTTYNLYNTVLFIEYLYSYMNLEEEVYCEMLIDDYIKANDNIIEFKNVSFKYPKSDSNVFKNLSFKIHQGDILAIVGENGSGKSTIISLLCRLFEVSEGNILFNDIPIQNFNLDHWRKEIRIIFQDFVKYELTLKENISIKKNISIQEEDKIGKIISMIGLDKVIDKLPQKIDTQLGVLFKEGMQLSQGEWQKISVGRALYKKGSILIFDEPSSALDTESEAKVFSLLDNYSKSENILFTIFVTHNRHNLKFANKILCLKKEGATYYSNIKEYMRENSDE